MSLPPNVFGRQWDRSTREPSNLALSLAHAIARRSRGDGTYLRSPWLRRGVLP